jgi:hypothetical protein
MTIVLLFLLIIAATIGICASIWFNCFVRTQINNIIDSTGINHNDTDSSISDNHLFTEEKNSGYNTNQDRSVPPINTIPITIGNKINVLEPNITVIVPD